MPGDVPMNGCLEYGVVVEPGVVAGGIIKHVIVAGLVLAVVVA